MRKIVTTYINPDMDEISLMYAYTELLRKKGEQANYYFEGTMKKEAEIVLDKFNIKLDNIEKIEDNDKIVLVDTNYLLVEYRRELCMLQLVKQKFVKFL